MLKLKKVEIQGFKSFCDRTELRFRGDGIAAVVGPNGCGKSNLSDAISWVLGEQSAKSLRGGRMEDVIFAGTRDRKAVGMASVTMTMLDPNGGKPVDAEPSPVEVTLAGEGLAEVSNVKQLSHAHRVTPGEITITRRLFRSGESEYLINGRAARLRDIQDIFMGSGLGPESYAIIEQGRIGQILSSRPYDRRAVIEEAAGITKFKTRKRLSEAKLESAKQNLARVFDILEEVTRQVNSLKRQAARTKRYGELKVDLDSRLRSLVGARAVQLEQEVGVASLELDKAAAALAQAIEHATSGEQERERLQALCYGVEARLTESRIHLGELNVESTRTRGKLESQVRETGAIEQRMARGEQESLDLDQRLRAAGDEETTLRATVAALEIEIGAARAAMVEKNQAREALQNRVREQEKCIEAERIAVLRLLGEASTLKNQLAQVDEFLAGIERESGRVRREEESATNEVERLAVSREKLTRDLGDRQLELESVTGERTRAERDLIAHKRTASELRTLVDQLRGETSRLRARKESLENVLNHHSYTTESVKKLLSAFERSSGPKPLGVLADFVDVDPRYERAAEEFLHYELEYVVVKDWVEAEAGMSLLRSDIEGRATFVVESAAPSLQGAVTALDLPLLTSHLRMTNGLAHHAAALLPRLTNCYIAESAEQGRELAAAHPQCYFLLEDGSCYQGQTLSGGRKKSSGPLAIKREVRELATALVVQEKELATQTKEQERVQREIAQTEADVDRLRQLQQTREKDALALQHETRKLAEENSRAASRISVARLELERLQRETERSAEQRAKNIAAVAEKDALRLLGENALDGNRAALEDMEFESARTREEHSAVRASLAALEERFRAQAAVLQRLEGQSREMSNRRANLQVEIQRLGENRSRLLGENIDLDKRTAQLAEEILAVESTVAQLAAIESEQRLSLAAADKFLKDIRAQIESGHTKRSGIEVELVRRQSELKFLDETTRNELGLALAEVERPECAIAPEALIEIEQGYLEVKSRIENLGPINPTALEEFEEASVRQEFLTTQRQDLIDSIRDTEKAIQEIDVVSKSKFLDAFEAINRNFRECFTTLFGGGTGEMRLTDEENANESGIDIVASPPGKKLQNILLLSGGEKALAALALLMAIFRFQPSPFCVLDEVDAPLDEANIGRLTRLLREMSLETQFIVITHSKKTMEAAQSMYGVTMQEAGVSKLVSVRFQGERLATPAVA